MAGGMIWDRRLIQDHLRWWHFVCDNPACGNEPPPKQTPAILQYLREEIALSPVITAYEVFDKHFREILEAAQVSCSCKKGGCRTAKSCDCVFYGVVCSSRCTNGASCKNRQLGKGLGDSFYP